MTIDWRAIALAYDNLARYRAGARYSFDAMARDELRQFRYLQTRVRVQVWTRAGQPYDGSHRMMIDVLCYKHLWVFGGGSAHPCRDYGAVIRGRAVHDVYGHALPGNDFSPTGELAAFRAHALMYSAAALPALASDNLGQTAYYYFHPVNEGKVHSARIWPEQKVDVLPEALWRHLL